MSNPQPTTWTIHLAAGQRGRLILAAVLIGLALLGVQAIGGSWVITALAALLLIGSIAEFLFPVTYTLDADGAHARHLGSHRVLEWRRVQRVYLRPGAVKLSPLAARGWVESYRGVLLRTPDRDATLAAVLVWLEAAGVTPEIRED